MKRLVLIILLMSAKVTFGQIINGGFEVWDTTYKGNYDGEMIKLFNVTNIKSGVVKYWVSSSPFGTNQTSDGHSGNYALILHNWYNYATQWITYRQALSLRPHYLQGFYKYITGGANGLNNGEAIVILTKSNGNSNDTVASGSFIFDSTVSYTPFQITLNYKSASTPDSITIYFKNSIKNLFSTVVSHLLYLDDLVLSDTPLGIEDSKSSSSMFIIYPNPVVKDLTIQNNSDLTYHLSIYNFLGEIIIEKTVADKLTHIDLTVFPNGVYFYKAISNDNVIQYGKIIKE